MPQERLHDNILMPFVMGICLPKGERDNSCTVELNFIPLDGKHWTISYASHPFSSREDVQITNTCTAHTTDHQHHLCSPRADLDLIKTWFEYCTRSHESCRDNRTHWFPTRLLNLGANDSNVRLITTADNPPDGPYVTLSHRWGNHQYTKLESSTIVQLQSAIDIFRLPQTFQDAISIARHIGIRYLWIDSLCIKQDTHDLSDWLEESQRMGQVYQSACLNISATRAKNGSEPLLGSCSRTCERLSQVELDRDGLLQSYYVNNGHIWDDEVENSPLLRRGWVFQERSLAPRVVHFGQSQLAWECMEHRGLGIFPGGLPGTMGIADRKDRVYTSETPSSTVTESANRFPDIAFAQRWQDLMAPYSRCELTYSRDKLIALDGISSYIMLARPGDTYASGMWRSTALYDLPWRRFDDDREMFPIDRTSYRAPSWSWASVDGEVDFPLEPDVYLKVLQHYAEVKELISPSMSQTGDITSSGKLRVEGLCFPLSIQWSEIHELEGFAVREFRFHTGQRRAMKSSLHVEVSHNVLSSLSSSENLSLMPLFATTRTIFGIILTCTDGPGTYRRIGAVEIALVDPRSPRIRYSRDNNIFHGGMQPTTEFLADISHSESQVWSRSALMFMDYLYGQRTLSHVIDIL